MSTARTPLNVSDQYTDAYEGLLDSLDANGANDYQQNALGMLTNTATSPNVSNAIVEQSNGVQGLSNQLSSFLPQFQSVARTPVSQAMPINATAASVGAPTSSGAYTGGDFAEQYANLYGSQVTDPALDAYDYGAMRGLSALDSRTASAGGFANSRSEIPYSDLIAQTALGRGQLSSQLNTQGLTSALGFAGQDASRLTQNNQFNSGQANQQSQFNAQLAQHAALFNAQNQTQNNQFNASAQNAQSSLQLNALNSAANILTNQAGLSNQIVQNIVTANGINTQNAINLAQTGALTQSQLAEVLNAAAAYNGSSYTQDTNSRANTTAVEAHART